MPEGLTLNQPRVPPLAVMLVIGVGVGRFPLLPTSPQPLPLPNVTRSKL